MNGLALFGGEPVRDRPFPPRLPYGFFERNAANEVVATGNLSGFIAREGDAFLGGPRIRSLETAWCEKFGVDYAVSMNSATSCLEGAIRALGIIPGDEVIVTPWSMSASATCVLRAGATPVFADIEPDTYGLSADAVAAAITSKTMAIVLVDLFGCPPRDLTEIEDLAEERNISIVEDAAQAIGAEAHGTPAGLCGDIGVFSLNRHKTLQAGEGGVAVTDFYGIAERLRDYRNHGEIRGGMLGGNYRICEDHAAIAEVQLGRLEELTEPRIRNAERITRALSELDGIHPPQVPAGLRHVFYLYAVRVPGSAERWSEALRAELPIVAGQNHIGPYVEPLYRLPIFEYPDHLAEVEIAYRNVLVTDLVHAGMEGSDIDDVIAAFQKVWTHREEL